MNLAQVTLSWIFVCWHLFHNYKHTETYKKNHFGPHKELVSFDVASLFSNVPIKETYDMSFIQRVQSKSILKQLLLKLTTGNLLMLTSKFYKQIHGYTMVRTLSVLPSDIIWFRLKKELVGPSKPQFYKRFVGDIINKGNK